MPSAPARVRERLMEEAALVVVAELPEAVPVLEPLLEGGERKNQGNAQETYAEVIVAELLEPPVADAPAVVDVRVGVEVSVTPYIEGIIDHRSTESIQILKIAHTTASQIAFAVLTAVVRSLPEHLEYMQSVTLVTNAWFLHVHAVSVDTHPPRSAFVIQVVAQAIHERTVSERTGGK